MRGNDGCTGQRKRTEIFVGQRKRSEKVGKVRRRIRSRYKMYKLSHRQDHGAKKWNGYMLEKLLGKFKVKRLWPLLAFQDVNGKAR